MNTTSSMSNNKNTETINRFYTAFSKLDATKMATCYADDVQFQDEIFTLSGKKETAAMWQMLTSATKANPAALKVWNLAVSGVNADANTGKAHWDANYLFSKTGRMVLNKIDAQFTFNEAGLIVRHHDSFNFWTWSRQAMGAPGLLLGWTPLLRNKVRAAANEGLKQFLARK